MRPFAAGSRASARRKDVRSSASESSFNPCTVGSAARRPADEIRVRKERIIVVVKLRIYSDRGLYERVGSPLGFFSPFWALGPRDRDDPFAGRFDHYAASGRDFFELVDLPDADLAVLPFDWTIAYKRPEVRELADAFLAGARKAGKQTIIFLASDLDEPVDRPDTIVLRCSLHATRRLPEEHALPAWSEDFVERYFDGVLPIRPWAGRPVVGFCGLAPGFPAPSSSPMVNQARRLRALVRNMALRLGVLKRRDGSIRSTALRCIQKSTRLKSNFLIRDGFMAGTYSDGRIDYQRLAVARREYVDNIASSDYVLCARGVGNFSFRLYEVLCSGRIPVFINTDCVLPFEDRIPWRQLCVWVESRDVSHIGERILKFHSSVSGGRFVELQRECRHYWETYLSPTGFHRNLYRHLNLAERVVRRGSRSE